MGNKLVPCKSCEKEVASSAKVCPHCGKRLKMGMFKKVLIGFVGLIVVIIALSPSQPSIQERLAVIESASATTLHSNGEIADIFSLGTDYTDIQRDNKEEAIKGQVIQWSLPVFEVSKLSENRYKVQTTSRHGDVGTFIYVYPRDETETKYLESLRTGNTIQVKGTIDGVLMRNIIIKPALLVQ